jgi:hypothetical protein
MPLKSPEAAVRSRLVATAGVTALIGTRIYPVIAPATAALPFVTWRRVAVERAQSLKGPIGTPTVSLSVDIFAETYESARDIADQCRQSLDGWGGTLENVTVARVSLENESDGFAQLAGGDLPPVYTVQQIYGILWQES